MAEQTVQSEWWRGLAATWRSDRLSRVESIVVLVLVALGTAGGIVVALLARPDAVGPALFQAALTASFALFVWTPVGAVAVLVASVPVSYAFASERETLLVLAIALGLVVRTGARGVIALFAAAFLVASAAIVMVSDPGGFNLPAALLAAAVSGAVGLVTRMASDRGRRLEERLAVSARAQQDAARTERQRIADELHDVIAHDLTIIAMHAQVLVRTDDAGTRQQSQAAISESAARALSDLRRVVAENSGLLADDPFGATGLADAIDAAEHELVAARHRVVVGCDANDVVLPRVVERTIARVLRESTTNVLKHGGRGDVRIAFHADDDAATLTLRNGLGGERTAGLPSGGYGTVRMAERARRLDGTFTAGMDGGDWLVTLRIPLR
ncbi:sensor histidine kinase [Microbacterium sp. VKM Ac-2923]|uniref:sensor histidine kinase n=1 Tax=Microbacterium sp. VKM Ac-2923 TaxID=2929476 RepID=UPI001FB25785|nr:histidine kinase [Microbacterium sp. VKM Ac-2923]MCJ1708562.1 histidine kinase [Microbacterium sp. VKM Ac-2923]